MKRKEINIIYLMPTLRGAAGGAKVIYNHSNILNNLGKKIKSQILHLKKKKLYKLKLSLSKRVKSLRSLDSGWEGKEMIPAKNFIPGKSWYEKKIFLKNDMDFNKYTDFVVIPEIWSHFAIDLDFVSKNIKYAIFVQGFYHMKSTSNFNKIKLAYENSKYILTDSDYSINYIKKMFPKCRNKIIRVNLSINTKKYKKLKKKNLITYMPRKLPEHFNLLEFYLKNKLPRDWKLYPIEKVNDNELIKQLCLSKIFLSFSNFEGIGMPPIEAALAGNKVIGYIGGGGIEYWRKPIFVKIENGEINQFGNEIVKSINNYSNKWIRNTQKQREALKNQYSVKNEIKSVKKLSAKILKLF